MTQAQLDREVAKVTGQSVSEIRQFGFSIADPLQVGFDPEPSDPLDRYIDWDALDSQRHMLVAG